MGFKPTSDGLDWYYEPDTTTFITDSENLKELIKEIERLNKIIDSTLKIIEQQDKIINILMKEE